MPINSRLKELLPDLEAVFKEFAFVRLANKMKLWDEIKAKAPRLGE